MKWWGVALVCAACKTDAPAEIKPQANAPGQSPSANAPKIRWVRGPSGSVAAGVKAVRAGEAQRTTLVYVGAAWCGPCQAFHKAAQAGELDALLPNLTLVEYDLDADRERLVKDGYSSSYIPLFVKPSIEGTPSDARIEGGTKGPDAARLIAERLRTLL